MGRTRTSMARKRLGNPSSLGFIGTISESTIPPPYTTDVEVVVPKETELAKLQRFWQDGLQLLRAGEDDSQLHNIARLNYKINVKNIPENLPDADIRVSCEPTQVTYSREFQLLQNILNNLEKTFLCSFLFYLVFISDIM